MNPSRPTSQPSQASEPASLQERIRRYSEELMRTYRRQNPAAAPPRNIAPPMPRAAEEEAGLASLPDEAVRGEVPPAPPSTPAVPPAAAEKAASEPAPAVDEDAGCRPHYPVDPMPAAGSCASSSQPASSGPEGNRGRPIPQGPGFTLSPVMPPARERAVWTGQNEEGTAEEKFIPPMVVSPPEEEETGWQLPGEENEGENGSDAIYAFPGRAQAREVSAAGMPEPPGEPTGEPYDGGRAASPAPSGIPAPAGTEDATPGGDNPLSDYIPPAPPETGIAQLRVWVTTARQAVPIEGARVVITKEDGEGEGQLIKILTTNQDGNTATVDLPAVPAEYSQKPGYAHPYTLYAIQISKPGYFTVQNNHVPLYGGISTIQPVDMTPLPEEAGLESSQEIVVSESAPENLQ